MRESFNGENNELETKNNEYEKMLKQNKCFNVSYESLEEDIENNVDFSFGSYFEEYSSFEEEINRYMKLAKNKRMNIESFWVRYKSVLPNLFQLVSETLVIPASQTSSEREFSKANLIKTDKRTRMSDGVFQKLTVIGAFSSQYINEDKKNRKRKRKSNIVKI